MIEKLFTHKRNFTRYIFCVGSFFVLLGCRPITLDQTQAIQTVPTKAAIAALPTTATEIASPSATPIATAVPSATPTNTATATPSATPTPTTMPTATPIPWGAVQEYGRSTQDIPLNVVQFGTGERVILFIGGLHGGYEWNTILLAYQAIDYFTDNPDAVPDDVTLYIIPSANPDGQYTVTFQTGRFTAADIANDTDTSWGRFNGNGVDLNRNWDCEWQPQSTWRNQIVSAGSAPFSEPETAALRDFILKVAPESVTFWHSAANKIFTSGCGEGIYEPSVVLGEIYSSASGYPLGGGFTAYKITGDAGNWLAVQGIPSITVELVNHQDLDWEKNLAGMSAVIQTPLNH